MYCYSWPRSRTRLTRGVGNHPQVMSLDHRGTQEWIFKISGSAIRTSGVKRRDQICVPCTYFVQAQSIAYSYCGYPTPPERLTRTTRHDSFGTFVRQFHRYLSVETVKTQHAMLLGVRAQYTHRRCVVSSRRLRIRAIGLSTYERVEGVDPTLLTVIAFSSAVYQVCSTEGFVCYHGTVHSTSSMCYGSIRGSMSAEKREIPIHAFFFPRKIVPC